MKNSICSASIVIFLVACASQAGDDPRKNYEELTPSTMLDAPPPQASQHAAESDAAIEQGRYLVELLACGTCHTDGALAGEPNFERRLAGSGVGIAYSNPLGDERPGIVYPANITPDDATGIGRWSRQQLIDAIRMGEGGHGARRLQVMPWQAYSKISEQDANAIAAYLENVAPVVHSVPASVEPGQKASSPYVYFGVYQSRD